MAGAGSAQESRGQGAQKAHKASANATHAGVCSPSASNVLSRPAVLRATNQTAERGVEDGLGWEWLQVETPLARTDVERRPRIQETTQRPRCQALLGATL